MRKIAAEFLRPVNQGLVPLGSASGFSEYVDRTYIPVVLEQMAASTKIGIKGSSGTISSRSSADSFAGHHHA